MTPAPSTVGPSACLDTMVERMRDRDLTNLLVTTSDGRLRGLPMREDAERGAGVGEIELAAAEERVGDREPRVAL